MPDTFVPHRPEELVIVKITKREAVLLSKLRSYAFGKFTVDKANGLLMRLVVNESQLIEESDTADLT